MMNLDQYFQISNRQSTLRRELAAGLTTFLSMVYSIAVIPEMLGSAGFDRNTVFIAACLTAAFGSLLMGLWARLPLAVGCAISLTAFTAYSLVIGQKVNTGTASGAVIIMGFVFTLLTVTGLRRRIIAHLPDGIAHGTGIGIGLFLILIAASSAGIVIKNPGNGLPVHFGKIASMPVALSLSGLPIIFALEKRRIPGSILIVIFLISILGFLFDPAIRFQGVFALPSFDKLAFSSIDLRGALGLTVTPAIFAFVLTAVFDATGTIRAVAGQAGLLDGRGGIAGGERALTVDAAASVFSGVMGASPAAVYVESAAGVAAGGRTGLTATVVGLLFLLMIFLSPLGLLIPPYATAPALMYVGLLMLGNVREMDFSDRIDALSGLVCAVFIVLACNIVTGVMLGYASLVIGRILSGEAARLNTGTVVIAVILTGFYASGLSI